METRQAWPSAYDWLVQWDDGYIFKLTLLACVKTEERAQPVH